MAYLKLRRRNLAPLLDANGWAVNARAWINVSFGRVLTHIARLPEGASRDFKDPYAEKKSSWPALIAFIFLLVLTYMALDRMGYLYEWTSGRWGQARPPADRERRPARAGAGSRRQAVLTSAGLNFDALALGMRRIGAFRYRGSTT